MGKNPAKTTAWIGLVVAGWSYSSLLFGCRLSSEAPPSWELLATTPTTTTTSGTPSSSAAVGTVDDGRGDGNTDDPIRSHIQKRSGSLWKVWDRTSVLHADSVTSPCRWKEFRPAEITTIGSTAAAVADRPPTYMCLYPREQDAYMSGQIEDKGRWTNCDVITEHILRLEQQQQRQRGGGIPITYIDIGANIGSCVMQVLLTTDAHVIAFEPTPKNLFYLTSTLLHLPQHLKDRVTLFPVALGDRPAVSTIVAQPTNAGNIQLKRSMNETGVDGATDETHNIPVERLDDLLGPDLSVTMIKMDVQGFECFVVGGMASLLTRTEAIMFEVEKKLYGRFADADACSGPRLVQALQRAQFGITYENGQPIAMDLTNKSADELKKVEFKNHRRPRQDMFGVKRSRNEGADATASAASAAAEAAE